MLFEAAVFVSLFAQQFRLGTTLLSDHTSYLNIKVQALSEPKASLVSVWASQAAWEGVFA